jgi:hypothetical protein
MTRKMITETFLRGRGESAGERFNKQMNEFIQKNEEKRLIIIDKDIVVLSDSHYILSITLWMDAPDSLSARHFKELKATR